MKSAASAVRSAGLRRLKKREFETEFLPSVPKGLRPAVEFLFSRAMTAQEQQIAETIEQFRGEIAATDATATSYSSPHSGTFERDADGKAVPGPLMDAPLSTHAQTGVLPEGGVLLRRLVEGFGYKSILELGTNTGFSGGYFLSAGSSPALITIEGSDDLCAIAQQNLEQIAEAGRFEIMNCLFDDALDRLRDSGARFDCAFIDGQHEKEATHYYTERIAELLNPNGAIIYDDIYWSKGMNDAWNEVVRSDRFAMTCDLASKGIAVLGDEPAANYDMCEYVGRPSFYRGEW